MKAYLFGIDFGTGGAKACITDEQMNQLSYAFSEYPIFTDHPGWSEHDPVLYWTTACRLIRECIGKAKIDPKQIAGVAASSAKPSLVMVGRDGEPINRAYNLMDRRATAQVARLEKQFGKDRIFRLTGDRLEDHPSMVNLLWEKENRPEDYARIYKALDIDGFITMKLTGTFQINHSGAPLFGVAYDLKRDRWDESILKQIGIDRAILPDINACAAVVGTVTPAAAEACGLAPGTPVCAGQVDCNAAWLGAGSLKDGDIQMNLGTCGNFGFLHQNTDFPDGMITIPYTIPGKLITVPTTTTGGQLIRYFRDTFCQMEAGVSALTGQSVYGLIDMEADRVPAGSDGLLMLPYMMGERTPIWDTSARGVLFGLSLRHTKGHVARAMMEAVAYALYDSFHRIREGGCPLNFPVVLNEGGAKSNVWRRIITDVLNVPTVLTESRTGAPYGDALLAGVACGAIDDFSIAAKKVRHQSPMYPDPNAHALYMDYFQIYRSLYLHLKEDFRSLAAVSEKYSQKPEAGRE